MTNTSDTLRLVRTELIDTTTERALTAAARTSLRSALALVDAALPVYTDADAAAQNPEGFNPREVR
jgi:hypothetical protein